VASRQQPDADGYVWPAIDQDDYAALQHHRQIMLALVSAIEERMREITGRDTPCWTPGHADKAG
jgi:hypothetical protein